MMALTNSDPISASLFHGVIKRAEKLGINIVEMFEDQTKEEPKEEVPQLKTQNYNARIPLPPDEDKNAAAFPGFKDGHVMFIGATGSGKTTALMQYLCYGLKNGSNKIGKEAHPLFDRNQKYYYCNAAGTPQDSISEIYKACVANEGAYSSSENWANDIQFSFYNFASLGKAFSDIEKGGDQKNPERKLLIVDDFQATDEAQSLLVEKLRNIRKYGCQVVLIAHSFTNTKGIVGIRKSIRYLIICNESPASFSQIIRSVYTEKDRVELTKKYQALGDQVQNETAIYRRKVIIDTHTNKIYYGTDRLLEFNSQYQLPISNFENETSKEPTSNESQDGAKKSRFF